MPDAAAEWERVGYHVLRELEAINRRLDSNDIKLAGISEMQTMMAEARVRDIKRDKDVAAFIERIEKLESRVEFVERRLYVAVVVGTGLIGIIQFLSSSGILQHFLGIQK